MSKIIKLQAEHVKRLRVVEIKPDGNVIVIGGRNGQGKSSVLDAIEYALGGDPDDPMPVHRGEAKAKVVVDLGDLVVQRTFTAEGGTSLVVRNKDGQKQNTPQAILDSLTGRLSFDPLEFARQKPDKQAETLRALVGLDFAAHDKSRDAIFSKRTEVNREVKQYEARMVKMPQHGDAPAAEQSAAAILGQQRDASNKNVDNGKVRHAAVSKRGAATSAMAAVAETERRLAALQADLERQREAAKNLDASATAAEQAIASLKDEDLSVFEKQLVDVELGNQKFRDNAQRAEVVRQFKNKTAEAETLTSELEALDSKKRQLTTEARYPVDGLLFDTAGGVTLGGIPFQQCSSAEQLRVSVAIGIALNPKLRVLLIRDGSLLDEDSLKLLSELAAKADAQVWLERVGTDAATSVVIEDGAVLEPK